jgi:site-specific recombinase
VLRNSLLALELEKNKEIQVVEGKKELEKSRTIGILSFCKENNHFLEKELTRLAEELLNKNISIESFTKELARQQRHTDSTRRTYEDAIAKLKQEQEQAQTDWLAQQARN